MDLPSCNKLKSFKMRSNYITHFEDAALAGFGLLRAKQVRVEWRVSNLNHAAVYKRLKSVDESSFVPGADPLWVKEV